MAHNVRRETAALQDLVLHVLHVIPAIPACPIALSADRLATIAWEPPQC